VTKREIDVGWTVRRASCHGHQLPDSARFQSTGRPTA
jgi:hypothetical protein